MRAASVLAAVALAGSTLTACSDPVPVLGAVLAELEGSVSEVLDSASAEGQEVLLTAAGSVSLALGNFESAYATQMNSTLNRVDDLTRTKLDELTRLSQTLRTDVEATLRETINGSQQLLNTLPFTNKNPQVRSYTPRVSHAGASGDVPVTVQGNFVWASEKGREVTLEVGGRTYSPPGNTTTALEFLVPAEVFQAAPDRVSHVSMTLTAPYEKGAVVKKVKPGVFRLLVTVLPKAPVRSMTITRTASVSGPEVDTKQDPQGASMAGGGHRLNSKSDCEKVTRSYWINPDNRADGWRIVPSSVKVVYSARDNDLRAWVEFPVRTPDAIQVQATTLPNCVLGISKDSGAMTYYVEYQVERTVLTEQRSEQEVPLTHWGQEMVLQVPDGKWLLSAVLFDGTSRQWDASDAANPNRYVRITPRRDTVHIAALSTADVLGV